MFVSWALSILFPSESGNLDDEIDIYAPSIFQLHADRRFFCTKKGCIGLGPQKMSVNDIVVVVQGSKTPLILRPKEDTPSRNESWEGGPKEYALVGNSWVDDTMEGQAATQHMNRGLEQELFPIR